MADCQMPISASFLDSEPNMQFSAFVIRYCVVYCHGWQVRRKGSGPALRSNFLPQ